MTDHNGAGHEPLTGFGTLGTPPAVRTKGGQAGAEAPFVPPPAPPPPPELSRRERQERLRLEKRELRRSTVGSVVRWVSNLHRFWWWFAGAVALLFMAALFALWFTGAMVRVATAPPATVTETSLVYRNGMPNPLERVKLTPEAMVMLGAHDTDRDGRVDELDGTKSFAALVAVLDSVDLCAWFVTVDPVQLQPVMSRTMTPGAVKLATCAEPIPPAATTTTAAPAATTTAAPAK